MQIFFQKVTLLTMMVYTYLHYTVLMPLESIYFSMFETESRDLGQTERRHRNAMTLNAIIEIHLVEG